MMAYLKKIGKYLQSLMKDFKPIKTTLPPSTKNNLTKITFSIKLAIKQHSNLSF